MARNIDVQTNDRVVEFVPLGPVKSGGGLLDNRLFTGENKLHIKEGPGGLWSLNYEMGLLHESLRDQTFTSFSKAFTAAKRYFLQRNVDIKEVV